MKTMATGDSGHWVLPAEQRTGDVKAKYKFGEQLGQPGQFGVANLAVRQSDGKNFAVKTVHKSKFGNARATRQLFADLRNEIEIMTKMEHPNIIVQEEVFEDRENLYIIMECCSGGELFDRISEEGQLTEKSACGLIRQILLAVNACHERNIAHCDLKPDNFLFLTKGGNDLKMIDFGMAKVVGRGQWLKTLVGTPYYTAPEIIKEPHGGKKTPQYGVQSDIWSVGVITFVTVFGFPPFYVDPSSPNEHEKIYKLIKKGFKPIVHKGYGAFFPKDIPVSDELKDFLKNSLTLDPAKRMTSTEALEHPWFRTKNDRPISETLISTLTNFRNKTKFRRTILTAIGHTVNSLTSSQMSDLQRSYHTMDTDHDGKVTYEEFAAPLYKSGVEEATIKNMFNNVDLDNSGDISMDELKIAFTAKIQASRDERLYRAFCSFDTDSNNSLSRTELEEVVKLSGIKEAGFDVRALLAEADSDGDGQVSWQEFARIMSQ